MKTQLLARQFLGQGFKRRKQCLTERGAETNKGIHHLAVLTAGATFLLIIAGALVTSNDAGLAVPDWPLSYGTWLPPMVGNIVYEHGHRMVAAFVGLVTAVLVVWLWVKEPRRWVRRLAWIALGTVILQAVLGGITVLFLLPRPVSIGHASLAQLFFCLTVTLAVVTGRNWLNVEAEAKDAAAPTLRRLAGATTAAIFVQLVLGAAYRHSSIGILPHVVGAGVVTVGVLWMAKRVAQRYAQQPALLRPAFALVGLLGAQLGLGIGSYLIRMATAEASQPELSMVVLTVAHVAVGALMLATSLVLTLQAHHRLAGRGEPVLLASSAQKATV